MTTAGESMPGYAKRLLELNDEAIDRLRSTELEGWARHGLAQDFAESWLPAVLKRFARAYPRVRIEVQVGLGAQLIEATLKGYLDIALVWGDSRGLPHAQRIADVPIRWIGRPGWPGLASLGREPLPFAAFAPPSPPWTTLACPGRLVFTSPSLSGLWAAAEGGLGITARTAVSLPKTLNVLDPIETGLPTLPCAPLTLHQAEAELSPAVARLTDILLETIREHVA